MLDMQSVLPLVLFFVFELVSVLSYAYTAAFGGLCLASSLVVLLRAFCLPPPSASRVNKFLERCLSEPVAHRGCVPENTLSGICAAKERGLNIAEVDLEYTKDGHPVLLHGPSVDRTSNGTGKIYEMTLEEVKKLDFGCKFGSEFVGEQIPTLMEALDVCEELDLLLLLDVKSNRRKTAAVLKTLFRERNLYDRVLVISFYPEILHMVRLADPKILVGQCTHWWDFTWNVDGSRRHDEWYRQMMAPFYDILLTFWNHNIAWWFTGLRFMLFYKGEITRDLIQHWKKRGVHLMAWTIESKLEAQYFSRELGVPVLMDDACKVI